MELYKNWLSSPALTEAEVNELKSLSENEIYESFYTDLKFGTAGIRGVLGMGTNKFNRFIVSKTTKALADVLKSSNPDKTDLLVVIGYDSRNFSIEFSRLCAEILASNGIKAYIFKELCPTPLVSFSVRHYGADAGINITASHNPKEYNGYKVYMPNGAQLDNVMADNITSRMGELDMLETYNTVSFDEGMEKGLIKFLGEETEDLFMAEAMKMTSPAKVDDFSVVFTPFFGAGHKLAPKALEHIGIKNIYCVEDQMKIDGNFPGLKAPNPEELSSYDMALALADEKGVDLVIATDPDADRVGIMARNKAGSFEHLTGNQTGCLLVDYIIKRGNLPEKPMVVKSIVTSGMVDVICAKNNVDCYSSFTGFRFIAEVIDGKKELEGKDTIIGLEESYGYLVGDFARDKDAITAVALIAEMATSYAKKGMTLVDALAALYEEYGTSLEETIAVTLAGSEGASKIQTIMKKLRDEPVDEICSMKVKQIRYFKDGYIYDFSNWTKMDMEGSDVVIYDFFDGTQFIIRPSGTEPKVKVYILANASSMEEANKKVADLREYSKGLFN